MWSSIKDLDEGVYYTKNIALFQEDRTIYPMGITNGYTAIDLKAINFNVSGPDYAKVKIELTNPKDVVKIITADSITIASSKE